MKPAELTRELAAGKIRPAYLLAGEEVWLRDQAVSELRAAVLGSTGAEAFNFDRLRGSECTGVSLRDAVAAMPVMAPRRLVLLVDADKARGAAGGLADALADCVEGLAKRDDCVLVVSADKPDRRLRWVKALAATSVDCEAPRDTRALVAFAREEAKRQGSELDDSAARLLVERVGPQLQLLHQEIAKAVLVAGVGSRVERSHVEMACGDVAEHSVWDLMDAIGEGRTSDALGLLARIHADGAPAPVLLGALASHFRKLARVASGGRVQAPPFAVRKLEGQASRYTTARLRACLDAIHEADLAVKGASELVPEIAIERLVLGLTA